MKRKPFLKSTILKALRNAQIDGKHFESKKCLTEECSTGNWVRKRGLMCATPQVVAMKISCNQQFKHRHNVCLFPSLVNYD